MTDSEVVAVLEPEVKAPRQPKRKPRTRVQLTRAKARRQQLLSRRINRRAK